MMSIFERVIVIALGLTLTLFVSAVQAQHETGQENTQVARQVEEPDAMDVVGNYLRKVGGIEAISRVKTATYVGVMEIQDAGISGDVNSWQGGGKFLMRVEIPALGKVEMGYNGVDIWEINPQSGDRILDETARADAVREYGFPVPEMEFIGNYEGRLVYGGKKQVGGKSLIQLDAVPNVGNVSHHYFDEATGLLVMVVANKDIQGTGIEVTTTISDYRKVDGLLLPHFFTMEAAGHTQTLEYTSIELGKGIDDTLFEMPESLSAKKAEGTGPEDFQP